MQTSQSGEERRSRQEQEVIEAVRNLLNTARSKGHTGRALLEINLNQGGVTGVDGLLCTRPCMAGAK